VNIDGPCENVFEALGLSEPDVRQAKGLARIALREAIEAQGMTQRQAAAKLGIPQSNLARALSASPSSLTWDKVFEMWTALGGRVQISFMPGEGPGKVEAEGPGMLFGERLAPPAEPPAPRKQAAERRSSTSARRK
jgi:predicted XRE-type DNA-binding protein